MRRGGGRLALVNLTEGEGDGTQFVSDWIERFSSGPIQVGGRRPLVAARRWRSAASLA